MVTRRNLNHHHPPYQPNTGTERVGGRGGGEEGRGRWGGQPEIKIRLMEGRVKVILVSAAPSLIFVSSFKNYKFWLSCYISLRLKFVK